MKDTANKKPSKECKAPPMVARLLTGLFLFLWLVIKRKKEKVCIFQDRKMSRGGVLIFVVADIWNCYNMDMFKLRYKQEYSADLSKNIIATAS
ncbi:MAG: hypothetical protein ACLTDX_25275 [[Clostridium] innocuum]